MTRFLRTGILTLVATLATADVRAETITYENAGGLPESWTEMATGIDSSAGAGGSVYVRVPHLVGSGFFSAAGGLSDQSSYSYAAGGGGRVAIWTRDTAKWTGTASAEGGYKHQSSDTTEALEEKKGEDGTVHWHYLPGPLCVIVK